MECFKESSSHPVGGPFFCNSPWRLTNRSPPGRPFTNSYGILLSLTCSFPKCRHITVKAEVSTDSQAGPLAAASQGSPPAVTPQGTVVAGTPPLHALLCSFPKCSYTTIKSKVSIAYNILHRDTLTAHPTYGGIRTRSRPAIEGRPARGSPTGRHPGPGPSCGLCPGSL